MPPSVDQSLSKAKRLARRGDTRAAATIYRRVLERYPQNRQALAGLRTLAPSTEQMNGLIALYKEQRYDEALAEAEALAETFPFAVFLPNLLGAVQAALGRTEAAVASYRRAIELAPDYAEARNNLGDSLNALGRPAEAIQTLTRALEIEPGFAEAHNNMGNALYLQGDIAAARSSYERAIELAPDYAEAHRNLSTVKKYREPDAQVRQMELLCRRPDASDRVRMNLGFALGKAHDDLGDPDTAFAWLSEGNRLRRAELPYDLDADIARFTRLRETFDAVPPPLTPADTARYRPVFIVGMPRSGTTLVEQILASHSRVHGAGELDLLDRAVRASNWETAGITPTVLASVRELYLDGIASIDASTEIVTDKMPVNFQWIGFIGLALPEARIVHVRRDARATCWSNFRHFFSSGGNRFANDLEDVARYYGLYAQLMRFWQARFPERIIDLRYETLTENQEPETRRLLDALGLDWEPACLEFHRTARTVPTASATQVRERLYAGSSEAWRAYAQHLGPMLRLLEGPSG